MLGPCPKNQKYLAVSTKLLDITNRILRELYRTWSRREMKGRVRALAALSPRIAGVLLVSCCWLLLVSCCWLLLVSCCWCLADILLVSCCWLLLVSCCWCPAGCCCFLHSPLSTMLLPLFFIIGPLLAPMRQGMAIMECLMGLLEGRVDSVVHRRMVAVVQLNMLHSHLKTVRHKPATVSNCPQLSATVPLWVPSCEPASMRLTRPHVQR